MGHYVRIRGWVELSEGKIEEAKSIIESYVGKCEEYEMDKHAAEYYNKGWFIPAEQINYAHFIFYGAAIRDYSKDYIKDQLKEIATKLVDIKNPQGVMDLEDEIEGIYYTWRLKDGKFFEFANKRKEV